MNDRDSRKHGRLALTLCLGGLVLAVAIGMVARLLHHHADMPAYLIFLGFQIAAFVLGMVSRQDALGRTAAIASGILAVGSAVFLI